MGTHSLYKQRDKTMVRMILMKARRVVSIRPIFYVSLMMSMVIAGCATDKVHRQGLDLMNSGHFEEGLAKLELASEKHPNDFTYRADLIREREWGISRLLQLADHDLELGNIGQAESGYRRVLKVDLLNSKAKAGLEKIAMRHRHDALMAEAIKFVDDKNIGGALERLHLILLENPVNKEAIALRSKIDGKQARNAPLDGAQLQDRFHKPVTLQFRDAGLNLVFDAISRASGINILLDKDIKAAQKTTVLVKDETVEDAIEMILVQNQLRKKIMNDNTILIYPDIPSKVKDYEELVIRTFHFTNADPKQMQTLLKTMLKTSDVFINEKNNSLVMRDTPDAVRLAENLFAAQDTAVPEVMLEVEVLEVLRSKLEDLGVNWPNQIGFSVTETPSETKSTIGLGGVITSTTSPPKPLTLESIKGLNDSLIKITPLTASIDIRKELGNTNMLASPRIRVRDHEKAKILIGDRVPVITNSVTPIASGSPVVTGSVQYLDVGLKLEVEPEIHLDNEVTIKTFLEVSNIAREVTNSSSGTVAYEIGTRSTDTILRLKDGETQVLAGLISDEDRKSASKVPGLGDIPLLGRLFSSNSSDKRKTEIILSITPHIIRNKVRPDMDIAEFWSGTDSRVRGRAFSTRPAAVTDNTAAADKLLTVKPSAEQAKSAAVVDPAVAKSVSQDVLPVIKDVPALKLMLQGAAQAKVGEMFKIAMQAQSDAGFNRFISQLGFDSAALEIVDVVPGELLKKNGSRATFTKDINQPNGLLILDVSLPEGEKISGKGDVATITFKARVPQAESQIYISSAASMGAGGTTLEMQLPGPVNVKLLP